MLTQKRFVSVTALAVAILASVAQTVATPTLTISTPPGAPGSSLSAQASPTPAPPAPSTVTLLLIGNDDRPLPGVRVIGYIEQVAEHIVSSLPETTSDAHGRITIPNLRANQSLMLAAAHPRHLIDDLAIPPATNDRVVRWKLKSALPAARGRVIDALTQQPIATARIQGQSYPDHDGSRVDVKEWLSPSVNPDGSFVVNSINPAWRTTLQVTAPGYVSTPVQIPASEAPPNQPPFTYALVRGLRVSGKITDPNGLFAGASYIALSCRHAQHTGYESTEVVRIHSHGNTYDLQRPGYAEPESYNLTTPIPAPIPFSIGELPAGPVTLSLYISGPQIPSSIFGSSTYGARPKGEDPSASISATITLELAADRDEVVIYAGPPPDAPLVDVVFIVPSGQMAAEGELLVEHTTKQQMGCFRMGVDSARFPVKNGHALVRLPSAGWISLHDTFLNGYRFAPNRQKTSIHVDGPRQEFVVELVPAAALDVNVVLPPATVAPELHAETADIRYELLSLHNRSDAPARWYKHNSQTYVLRTDEETRIHALPPHQTYRILAWSGAYFATSDEVTLATAPSPLAVHFTAGVVLQGRITDSEDRPVAALPLRLECNNQTIELGSTDANGGFVIPHFNPNLFFPQWLRIPAHSAHRPADILLNQQTPLELGVKLTRGHVVSGVLLDSNSGLPLAGIELHAYGWNRKPSDVDSGLLPTLAPNYPVDGPTDQAGRFRFSNLPDGLVGLSVGYSSHKVDFTTSKLLRGDQAEPLTKNPNNDCISLDFPSAANASLDLRVYSGERK